MVGVVDTIDETVADEDFEDVESIVDVIAAQ